MPIPPLPRSSISLLPRFLPPNPPPPPPTHSPSAVAAALPSSAFVGLAEGGFSAWCPRGPSRCAGLPRRRRGCPPHSCREPELHELANPEAAALVSFGCPELLIIWLQWSD